LCTIRFRRKIRTPNNVASTNTALGNSGRTREQIDALYPVRHLVHGVIRLEGQKDIKDVPKATQQLKALVVDALKSRLGIDKPSPPLAQPEVPISWSTVSITMTTVVAQSH